MAFIITMAFTLSKGMLRVYFSDFGRHYDKDYLPEVKYEKF